MYNFNNSFIHHIMYFIDHNRNERIIKGKMRRSFLISSGFSVLDLSTMITEMLKNKPTVLKRRRNDMNVGDDKNPVKYFLLMLSFPFHFYLFFFSFSYISLTCSSYFSPLSPSRLSNVYHTHVFLSLFSLSSFVFPSLCEKKTLLISSYNP